MKITEKMVDHVSALAHLKLPQEEKTRMAAELQTIVSYMDVLGDLDTTCVEPMSHVFPLKNVLREDRVIPSRDRTDLLDKAPASNGETYLVPRTVK